MTNPTELVIHLRQRPEPLVGDGKEVTEGWCRIGGVASVWDLGVGGLGSATELDLVLTERCDLIERFIEELLEIDAAIAALEAGE